MGCLLCSGFSDANLFRSWAATASIRQHKSHFRVCTSKEENSKEEDMKQANLLPTLAMALLLYPATQAVAQQDQSQNQNQNQNQNQGQSAQGTNRGGQYDI